MTLEFSHLKHEINPNLANGRKSLMQNQISQTRQKAKRSHATAVSNEDTSRILKGLYKCILNSIKALIVLSQLTKIFLLQIFYFFLISFESLKLRFSKQDSEMKPGRCKTALAVAKIKGISAISGAKFCVPNHICVILNEEEIGDSNIIRTFECLIDVLTDIGVRNLTFYQLNEISSEIEDLLKQKYLTKDSNNNEANNTRNSNKSLTKRSFRDSLNERGQSQQIKGLNLNFLSYSECGKNVLVNVCRGLAKNVKGNKLEPVNIDKNLIDEKVIEATGLNEPELIISIGTNDTLVGFSPWHIRLSEIIKIKSYKLINQLTLVDVLVKYSKIEKRLGK